MKQYIVELTETSVRRLIIPILANSISVASDKALKVAKDVFEDTNDLTIVTEYEVANINDITKEESPSSFAQVKV